MVVGFDVYHEASMRGVTVRALVATMDKDASKYFSAVSHLHTGEEMSTNLTTNVVKSLHQYFSYNHCLPQRILVYCDGVGEGQVAFVFQQEVELLRKKLKEFYQDKECNLAFIIVTKRLNTRLFHGSENPPPGTVADGVITLPHRYNFYLESQSVHQGTVSPTSYNIVSDNLGLEPDQLQRLTCTSTGMEQFMYHRQFSMPINWLSWLDRIFIRSQVGGSTLLPLMQCFQLSDVLKGEADGRGSRTTSG